MNNAELKTLIDRYWALNWPMKIPPKLMGIDENLDPIDRLDFLIDFVFIDHRYCSANYKEAIPEIYDILMDIGNEVIKGFSMYVKAANLKDADYLRIEAIRNKLAQYFDTREHNLHGIFVKLASKIQEVIKDTPGEISLGNQTINNKPEYNTERIKKQVVEILKEVFSGSNLFNRKIMSDIDYHRLVEYTITLIEKDKLPQISFQIPKINLTDQFILTTYRRIYDLFDKDKDRRKLFSTFIYNCFFQFKNVNFSEDDYTKSVIYKKFTKPDSTYWKDLERFSH
jgi:hypothetical protein